jgi:hypothetical protein
MGLGQTWVYDPSASTLTMIFKSPSYEVCDGPDNCCVTPRGGLILCEDAGGRAVPASALTIGTDIRSGAKPAQHHRVCGCVLQSRRPHAVRESVRQSNRPDNPTVPKCVADSRGSRTVRARRDASDLGSLEVGPALRPAYFPRSRRRRPLSSSPSGLQLQSSR